jgi:hypothetical protein
MGAVSERRSVRKSKKCYLKRAYARFLMLKKAGLEKAGVVN